MCDTARTLFWRPISLSDVCHPSRVDLWDTSPPIVSQEVSILFSTQMILKIVFAWTPKTLAKLGFLVIIAFSLGIGIVGLDGAN